MISVSLGSKWVIYIVIIFIIIIALWWVFGRKESYEFIGIKPLLKTDGTWDTGKPWWEKDIETNLEPYEKESFTSSATSVSPAKSSIRSFRSSRRMKKVSQRQSCRTQNSERSIKTPIVNRRNRESKGEFLCRQALTKIFKKPFPIRRPNFLKSPKTGRNLELDGYNEELSIAFEFQGKQHYVFPNIYHNTEEEFTEQLKRDQWKLEQCDEQNVYLIRIPYNVPYNNIKKYIEERLPRWSMRS